jgi:hypothetical protein
MLAWGRFAGSFAGSGSGIAFVRETILAVARTMARKKEMPDPPACLIAKPDAGLSGLLHR